jgi:uncharacterized protein (TIGR03067 family)
MDLQQLQGAWKAVGIEHEGNSVPEEVAQMLRYIFEDDQVGLMESDNKTGGGTIRLDATQIPKVMDITLTEGPQSGKTVFGIYEVDWDSLRLCVADERPTSFSGAGKAALIELRREKRNQP